MQWTEHLSVITILIPLIGGITLWLFEKKERVYQITVAILLCAGVSLAVLLTHLYDSGQPVLYALGNWQAPLGIVLKVDVLANLMGLLILFMALVVLIGTKDIIMHNKGPHNVPPFLSIYLLCVAGLLGIVLTHDVFNAYVFIEIYSLTSYSLVAMGSDRRAMVSAFYMLLLGTIGATLYLLGIGFLYMHTGTLTMYDMARRLPAVENLHTVKVGMLFITLGLCCKIALFPFQQWLVRVYREAPTSVVSLLSACSSKVGLYLLIRFYWDVWSYTQFKDQLLTLLWPIAIVSIVVGALGALFTKNVREMLAYSSITHLGYILTGLCLGNDIGLIAAILTLMWHALCKSGLFMITGYCENNYRYTMLQEYGGLHARRPFLATSTMLFAMGLVGLPLTGGFIAKWYFMAALTKGHMAMLALYAIASVVSVIYVGRFILIIYHGRKEEMVHTDPTYSLSAYGVIMFMLAILFYGGINGHMLTSPIQQAVSDLIRATPLTSTE